MNTAKNTSINLSFFDAPVSSNTQMEEISMNLKVNEIKRSVGAGTLTDQSTKTNTKVILSEKKVHVKRITDITLKVLADKLQTICATKHLSTEECTAATFLNTRSKEMLVAAMTAARKTANKRYIADLCDMETQARKVKSVSPSIIAMLKSAVNKSMASGCEQTLNIELATADLVRDENGFVAKEEINAALDVFKGMTAEQIARRAKLMSVGHDMITAFKKPTCSKSQYKVQLISILGGQGKKKFRTSAKISGMGECGIIRKGTDGLSFVDVPEKVNLFAADRKIHEDFIIDNAKDKVKAIDDIMIIESDNEKTVDDIRVSDIYVGRKANGGNDRFIILKHFDKSQHNFIWSRVLIGGNTDLANLPSDYSVGQLMNEYVDVSRYNLLIYSPSNTRNDTIVLLRYKPLETVETFNLRRETIHNVLTHYFYDAYKGHKMKRATAAKKSARHALPFTPNTNLCKIPSYAIFMGEFRAKDGTAFMDGSAFASAELIQVAIFNKTGVMLPLDVVTELRYQMRTLGVCKTFTNTVTAFFLDTLINNSNRDVVYINTPELIADFSAHFDDENDNPYANKFCVFGAQEGEVPMAVFDLNNMKGNIDFSIEPEFNVLDMARKSPAHTNKQIFSSLSIARRMNDNTIERFLNWFVPNVAMKHIDHQIDTFMSQKKFIDMEAFEDDVVKAMSFEYYHQDTAMWNKGINNLMNSLSNAISRTKYDIEGATLRGTGDVSILWGYHLLKKNEFFAPGVKSNIMAQITRCPHIGFGEQYIAKNISLTTIIRRVMLAKSLNHTQKAAIIEFYSQVPESVIVCPGEPTFCRTQGGSDYDYDCYIVITNKDWVQFAMSLPEEAVEFDATKGSDEKVTYDLSVYLKMYLSQTFTPNIGVGPATNRTTNFIALMNSMGMTNEEKMTGNRRNQDAVLFEDIMKEIATRMTGSDDHYENAQQNNGIYQRMFGEKGEQQRIDGVNNIGDKEVRALEERFINSDMSHVSYNLFAVDTVLAYASIIGRAIDSAKTGERVESELFNYFAEQFPSKGNGSQHRNNIKAAFLLDYALGLNEKDEVTLFVKTTNYAGEETLIPEEEYQDTVKDHITIFEDRMNNARKLAFNYAIERINAIRQPEKANSVDLEGVTGYYSAANDADLKVARNIFADLMHTPTLSTTNKEEIKVATRNMIRMSFDSNANLATKYYTIKRASMTKQDDDDSYRFSTFYTQMLPEVVHYLATHKTLNDINTVAGFEINCLPNVEIQEGDVVTLVNGVSEDKTIFATNRTLNGDFMIQFDNGKPYATEEITELMPIPEITNDIVLQLQNVPATASKAQRDLYAAQVEGLKKSGTAKIIATKSYSGLVFNETAENGRISAFTPYTIQRCDYNVKSLEETILTSKLNGKVFNITSIKTIETKDIKGAKQIKHYALGKIEDTLVSAATPTMEIPEQRVSIEALRQDSALLSVFDEDWSNF